MFFRQSFLTNRETALNTINVIKHARSISSGPFFIAIPSNNVPESILKISVNVFLYNI